MKKQFVVPVLRCEARLVQLTGTVVSQCEVCDTDF